MGIYSSSEPEFKKNPKNSKQQNRWQTNVFNFLKIKIKKRSKSVGDDG